MPKKTPATAPLLPALHTFLRRSPREMGKAVLTLWSALGRLGPRPPAGAGPPPPPTPEAQEVDECHRWIAQNLPEIGKAARFTLEDQEGSRNREASLVRLRGALTDLGEGVVDTMGLARAGLHGICVRTGEIVAGILASPEPQHSLRASWRLVEEAEARPQRQADKTRQRTLKNARALQPLLARAAEDAAARQAIERLLEVAGLMPDAQASVPAPRPLPARRTGPAAVAPRTAAPRSPRAPARRGKTTRARKETP